MSSPMATKHPGEVEQEKWDDLLHALIVECVRREGLKKALACVSLARDVADAARTQRRESIEAAKS